VIRAERDWKHDTEPRAARGLFLACAKRSRDGSHWAAQYRDFAILGAPFSGYDLVTLELLIENYGYLAILILTFFEGETIVILAGVAAHLGLLELQWVILSGAGRQFRRRPVLLLSRPPLGAEDHCKRCPGRRARRRSTSFCTAISTF